MGITTRTITEGTCDAPHCDDTTIAPDTPYVDYSYAGFAFHNECLRRMTALEFICATGGDNIYAIDVDGDRTEFKHLGHIAASVDATLSKLSGNRGTLDPFNCPDCKLSVYVHAAGVILSHRDSADTHGCVRAT